MGEQERFPTAQFLGYPLRAGEEARHVWYISINGGGKGSPENDLSHRSPPPSYKVWPAMLCQLMKLFIKGKSETLRG
ncbi:hypothetical protein Ancab_020999 [Ancistrocladus abbreviatus]